MVRRTSKKVKKTSWLSEQLTTAHARQVFEEERLTLSVTDGLLNAMAQHDITRAELARHLGRTRAYVSQLLAGTRNMTLHTLADLALAVGCRASFELTDLEVEGYRPLLLSKVEMRKNPLLISAPEPSAETWELEGAVAADNSNLSMAA